MNKRTHIVIPQDLAQEIESLVGKRGRSQFLAEAAWKEVRRLRILAALKTASGAWQKRSKPAPKGRTDPRTASGPQADAAEGLKA